MDCVLKQDSPVGIANFDLMVSGTQIELLQFVRHACETAVNVNGFMLEVSVELHFTRSRAGNVDIRRSPWPVRPVPGWAKTVGKAKRRAHDNACLRLRPRGRQHDGHQSRTGCHCHYTLSQSHKSSFSLLM